MTNDHENFEQGPDERVPYGVRVVGDTISTASWSITNGGTVSGALTLATEATVFVSNLTLGQSYELEGVITTTGGSVRTPCFNITCVDPCAND